MAMKNPPHPGRSIRDACLNPLNLSVTEAANVLGVARHTLSRVINGHAGISPDMAIRLGEGRLVERGSLATSTDGLRACSGARARRPHSGRALRTGP